MFGEKKDLERGDEGRNEGIDRVVGVRGIKRGMMENGEGGGGKWIRREWAINTEGQIG
jgi:hypothetical protein